ncbi:MAG: hypothetical protein DA443_09810, partial [Bacteroidetes bacterium]
LGEGEGEGEGAGERVGVGADGTGDGADEGARRPRFVVAIIPYTWDFTNLKEKQEGDLVNLEFDMFGKYIIKYMKKLRG